MRRRARPPSPLEPLAAPARPGPPGRRGRRPARATCAPMPRAAPVMRTILPARDHSHRRRSRPVVAAIAPGDGCVVGRAEPAQPQPVAGGVARPEGRVAAGARRGTSSGSRRAARRCRRICRSIPAVHASCASRVGSSAAMPPGAHVAQRREQVVELALDHADHRGVAEPGVRAEQEEQVGEAGDRRAPVARACSAVHASARRAPVAAADQSATGGSVTWKPVPKMIVSTGCVDCRRR